MEDAHVVETKVPYPPGLPYLKSRKKEDIPNAKVFGVFDGHGGPEVARFCQLYLVSVLTKQALWQEAPAAEDSEPDQSAADDSIAAEDTGIGQALIESFHALDRMIDDPERRDEIVRLRTLKAPPTERRDCGEIPPVKPIESTAGPVTKVADMMSGDVAATNILPPPPPSAPAPAPAPEPESAEAAASSEEKEVDTKGDDEKDSAEKASSSESTAEEDSASASSESTAETEATAESASTEDSSTEQREEEAKAEGEAEKDYDSDEAVGKEEAARESLDEDDEDSNDDVQINPYDGAIQVLDAGENESAPVEIPANKVSVMFQRLLNMNENQSGQMVVQIAGESAGSNEQTQAPVQTGPSAANPSVLQNGRLMCNLPDHPIHAGCTAVVAVLLGMTLTVANAGDSRAVLCRAGGTAEPLSFDHKPQQPREMNRINNSGGFVNRFGRVNGNLNLSRSIGDLKYKQVPGIAPKDQMITAQPDILQVTLNPEDEFFILGCDGIWDCLTNEKAVEFVRERIDTQEPKDICEEMLNTILSDDPRATQGIGGDNMTVMIVDLQPASRSYKVDPSWGPETTSPV